MSATNTRPDSCELAMELTDRMEAEPGSRAASTPTVTAKGEMSTGAIDGWGEEIWS